MRDVPRRYTVDEVRDQFLARVWHIVRYWQKLDNPQGDRVEGAVFSVLAMLDGTEIDLPGFVVAPAPHHTDREYCLQHGENYFPEAPQVECDIAGRLHDFFFAKGRLIP